MTQSAPHARRMPWWVPALIVAILVLLIVSNARFVMLAIESDPGCVPHQRTVQTEPGKFRAARSHCRSNGSS